MTPKHHHGYSVSQYRHRSWFTRQCAYPWCGAIALTWPARVLVGALAVLVLLVGALAL